MRSGHRQPNVCAGLMRSTSMHNSPAAAAEWAAGCSQRTLAVLGGRRDPWAQRIRAGSVRPGTATGETG